MGEGAGLPRRRGCVCNRLPLPCVALAALLWHLSRRRCGPDPAAAWSAAGGWQADVLANSSYADRVGSATVVLYRRGQLHVRLAGWGNGPLVEGCLHDLEQDLARIPTVSLYVYLDMLAGRGSSPRAVAAALQFMGRVGHRVKRVAVVGPPPIIAFMRILRDICRQEGVEFFGRGAKAEAWLSEQLARSGAAGSRSWLR
ncbi:unnamed protein product [Prorocentrum cordatum]|uniref:STAS/SEC14 domain-containing protein n=1 Tax=Prorocentrum cordatum TaxID=2364126 RepID=A0ABN9PX35_9DINO|nr:unnamed protein product [Polarella glacialis]